MAFGCRDSVSARQWPPNSEANSSTLSPLARPFVVVRNNPKFLADTSGRPYRDRPDHFVQPTPSSAPADVYSPAAAVATDLGRRQGGLFPSGGSDWLVRRTLSSNLVQAEPFYPQYGFLDSGGSKPPPVGFGFNERSDYDCLDRNHTLWNVPFEGDSEWENGARRRISSWMEPRGLGTEGNRKCLDTRDNNVLENSSWAVFSDKGRISNHVPAIQHGDNDDVSLHYDDIWHRNHVESYVIKGQDTGHLNWLDGSSMRLQTSTATSTNLLDTSVLSENLSATAPVLQITVPDASKESCGTLCASTSPYHTITPEPGFHRSEQNDCYVDTAYSYPKISSPTLRKMSTCPPQKGKCNTEPLEPHLNNSLHRRRVSVTIREPNTNSYSNVGKLCADKSDKCNDMSESCRLPRPPLTENRSGSESKTGDLKSIPDRKTEMGKISLSINGFTDVHESSHNCATVDQSNNAVDSPCWKGASASRYSPLFDSDLAGCSNASQKFETLELISLTEKDTRSQVSEGFESFNNQDGNLILKEVKGDSPSKDSCPLPSGTSATIGPLITKSSCGNGNLNGSAATQSFLLDSASDTYHCVKGNVPSSSAFEVFNSEKSAKHKASEAREISSISYFDTHFLVRSIYDLSALLSSCYNGENMLKESDYDVLLMAKCNLEACLEKKFELQKENFVCQQKASYIGDTCDPIEECRKTLTQDIYAHGENGESSAYKRLWIEAEAALCSVKYQLQVAKASVGLSNNADPPERDLQGTSESGESPVEMMKTSSTTAVCDFVGESQTPIMTYETLMNNNAGFGDIPGSCHIRPHVTSESNKEGLEASVMARLNVLRSRDSRISTMSTQKQNEIQSLVASETNTCMNQTSSVNSQNQFITGMGSFTVPSEPTSAKSSISSRFTSKVRSPNDKITLLSSANSDPEFQLGEVHRTILQAQAFPEEACLASRTENIIESYIPDSGLWRAQLTGKHSTAGSSDWEHVLKEDVTR